MIKLKTKSEIETLRAGGRRLAQILAAVAIKVVPGVKTGELDDYARELIKDKGATSSFLNYRPAGSPLAYPAALCVSINDEVVHGVPGPRLIKSGDIVSLDLGLKYEGLFTDAALTVIAGEGSKEAKRLVAGTKEALMAAIKTATAGARVGAIGAVSEAVAKRHRLGIIRDLVGHGVGYAVHEEPAVPNFGRPSEGEALQSGLVIAIEPMFTLGAEESKLLPDGLTLATVDGSLAAHFEHTVAITEHGPEVLTAI